MEYLVSVNLKKVSSTHVKLMVSETLIVQI